MIQNNIEKQDFNWFKYLKIFKFITKDYEEKEANRLISDKELVGGNHE